MMKYLISIQYLGKNYSGFQIQQNGITIQQKLEEALMTALNQKIEVFASGRTDAGVNAICQTAHFEAETTVPANKIPFAVNKFLPADIKILSCKRVKNNFHARFDVKKKTYVYNTYVSPITLPICELTAYQLKKMPNLEQMKLAAQKLVGEHNFKAFMSAGGQSKTFVRTIYSIKITKKSNIISFEVCGNGFLYNMVRIIVGTLLEVGYGRKTPEDVALALEKQNRSLSGYLVPPHGLFLKNVKY
jgi:tRNA pseudouridine38-40 synthase